MTSNRLVGAATLSVTLAVAGHWIGEQPVSAQSSQVQGTLSFFKNYFVTGDYVVRGASLWRKGVNGKAVVTIPKLGGTGGVPPSADILAAFLYVQTTEKIRGSGINNAKFNNISLGPFTAPSSTEPGSGTYAVALPSWDQAMAPCWSTAFPPVRRLITYRVDVFRFLPIDPATGKQDLNKTHRLEVPDSGKLFGEDDEGGNEPPNLNGPRAIGGSLVVVYRDPTKPYKGITLHDGAFTKRAFQTMTQAVNGWYQASTGGPKSASLTQVVGDGRLFLSERVFLNGQLISTNPFRSANGPKWDNWRTNITLPNGASSASLRIEPHTILSDCTHHSVWIVDTTVQDTDADGLLDIWETNNNGLGLSDPNGLALPDISSMADPNHKDVFVEVAYMHAKEGTTYGGVPKPQHTHRPRLEALNLVGDTLKNAPVSNPDGVNGINVHFDVGQDYQFDPPNPYIVPSEFARGGKNMSETALCPNPADPVNGPPVECVLPDGSQGPMPGQYPDFPGTVGYMTGLRFVQELLGFDRNRKDIYRYLFSGHFLGLPQEACQLPDGPDPDTEPDGNDENCQLTNPKFHIPRTNSGIAEYPGKHFMVTLGGFDDEEGKPVGTADMQAGTILHEFGHTVELTHAGPRQNPRLENCLPFYFSTMNYAYQLRGLLDANAVRSIGFSAAPVAGLDENLLSDGDPYGPLPFRLGFYAPFSDSYVKLLGNPATKHCDGSELSQAEKDEIAAGRGMVRVDHVSLDGSEVDWDADGTFDGGLPPQDLNFNGLASNLGQGVADWPFVARRLNQLGAGRNVGGLYIDALGRRNMGPLSLDVGRGDIGRGDIGRGDIGRGDIGRGDIGRGDIGRGDIGRGDIGRGDIGRGDIGRGDIGKGDTDVGGSANEPFGEIDLETAKAVSGDAPPPSAGLAACLTDDGECVVESGDVPVRLDWQAPAFGTAVRYFIYRFDVNPEAPFPPEPEDLPTEAIATVVNPGEGPTPTTYIDESAEGGANYAYFVIAEFPDDDDPDESPEFSGISNFARISTPLVQLQLPDLVIANYVPSSSVLTTFPGGQVTLSAWRHQNQGNGDANAPDGTVSNGFYLSSDPVITPEDVRLDGNTNTNGVLPAGGGFDWGGPTLTIPPGTTPGTYFIGILVDEADEATESDEGNNYVSEPIRIVPGEPIP
jgi:hypothetical protein